MTNKDVTPDASRVIAGRYRLDELVASSPFAEVWRGFDLNHQRTVAVKIGKPGQLCPKKGSDPLEVIVSPFKSDARRGADPLFEPSWVSPPFEAKPLKHPGILPVHDAGMEDGTWYVVSDFIEGGSLQDFVGRQILSKEHVIRWMTDIAEALEFAHSTGVIHGDIKPANLLIDLQGRAFLADFGMVRPFDQHRVAASSIDAVKYMSPEQIEGKAINVRSDIYQLGVVLHELLTGHVPYRSTERNSLQIEISRGVQLNSKKIPVELRRICRKALAVDVKKRYSSAELLVDDLRRASSGSSTRRMLVWSAGIILFIVGFGISAWFSGGPPVLVPRITMNETDWMAQVISLRAKDQVAAVSARLVELNEGFDGELSETIEDGVVTELALSTDDVRDISPIRALAGLKSLTCFGTLTTNSNGKLANLSPLRGLLLKKMTINNNERIDDLTPLEGMPLTFLHCGRTSVSDLAPLKNSPLTILVCHYTNVSDLSPLSGTKLTELDCDHTGVADLSPLEGLPLEQLHCADTPLTSLTPLHGLPLKVLDCFRTLVADLAPLRTQTNLVSLNVLSTKVEDLAPLKDLPNLKLLWCDFDEKRDAEILRSLKTLEFINDNPVSIFWREVEALPEKGVRLSPGTGF